MLYRREDRSGGRDIRSHESVPESHEHQEQRPKTPRRPVHGRVELRDVAPELHERGIHAVWTWTASGPAE
jgi:hypothetical protein